MTAPGAPILSVTNLIVEIATPRGIVRPVNDVSFEVLRNEVLCIVGESGSGKSMSMLATMGLLPPGAHITGGSIAFQGRDLAAIGPREMRALRGRALAMVFQDPMTALNPVLRIGDQIAEMIALHEKHLSRATVRDRVVALLGQVNIPNPDARYAAYPHELSGGMRQRVMIAMALAHSPALLIADEPTTALDVTIQAQILALLRTLRAETGSALVLITHDLGVVAETADQVLVMYGSQAMERARVADIFLRPRHPYTIGLLASMLDARSEGQTAYAIPGRPPTPATRQSGCVFQPRCGLCRDRPLCARERPAMRAVGDGHTVACHFAEEVEGWISAEFPFLEAAS